MSSSTERLELPAPPVAVRVRPGSGDAALAAFLDEQLELARDEALARGRQLAREELGQLVAEAADRCAHESERHLEELAQASVQMGLAIARELLRIELVAGGHDIESAVRTTLSQLRSSRDACRVVLHPEDHERLADVPFRSSVELVADPSVRRGDVVVESPQGRLVRSLDDALEAIGAALRAELAP